METFLGLCGLSEKVIVGGIWRLCALDKCFHMLFEYCDPTARDAHDMPYTRAFSAPHMLIPPPCAAAHNRGQAAHAQ